jgi:2-polyprenyl-3-methyl-5-hydroxy-6-metoxy-1,4-benzoquinol methylase
MELKVQADTPQHSVKTYDLAAHRAFPTHKCRIIETTVLAFTTSENPVPHTTTNAGLHEFVARRVLDTYARPGMRAVDLGSGPGAMAMRLRDLGCETLAVDRDASGFEGGVAHQTADFNQADFATVLGEKNFDLVTAIEVIEHVESPIGFLRNIRRLLTPSGVAVLTTPNVDSLPARIKFLIGGKIRTMDENGEPTHISPIFFDLLRRQFLPLTGTRLREHLVFPPKGYQLTRKRLAWMLRLAAQVLPGESLLGDNHVLVVEAAS